jgi:hypothetical protein
VYEFWCTVNGAVEYGLLERSAREDDGDDLDALLQLAAGIAINTSAATAAVVLTAYLLGTMPRSLPASTRSGHVLMPHRFLRANSVEPEVIPEPMEGEEDLWSKGAVTSLGTGTTM